MSLQKQVDGDTWIKRWRTWGGDKGKRKRRKEKMLELDEKKRNLFFIFF